MIMRRVEKRKQSNDQLCKRKQSTDPLCKRKQSTDQLRKRKQSSDQLCMCTLTQCHYYTNRIIKQMSLINARKTSHEHNNKIESPTVTLWHKILRADDLNVWSYTYTTNNHAHSDPRQAPLASQSHWQILERSGPCSKPGPFPPLSLRSDHLLGGCCIDWQSK